MDDGRRDNETRGAGGRMTTTIARPRNRRASDAGRSRLADFRRRVVGSRRYVPRLSSTWLFGLAALAVAGAIAAALFGLPVRTWFDQDRDLQALEHQLTEMQDVNQDLQAEVERLQTDEGVTEAAREELGHVAAGDHRQTMLDIRPLPRDLPAGWPYSQVDAILNVRAAEDAGPATTDSAAPDATTATTSAPTTTIPVPTTTTTVAP
jgi:uncharacterized protein HemX